MLEVGMKGSAETIVDAENTAAKAGSGALCVFGTPYMVALMENAALRLMAEHLPEGKGSVGTALSITIYKCSNFTPCFFSNHICKII